MDTCNTYLPEMKIGITYTGAEEKQQNYHNWLNSGDTNGFELVTLFPEGDLPALEEFAGLIFSGGIDIHPSYYGLAEAYPNAPSSFNAVRDKFEKLLFEKTQDLRLPVLGICRGMQLVNVLSGGTLKQDLGERGNEIHRAIPADKIHDATVCNDTLLKEILDAAAVGTVGKAGGENITDLTAVDIHINSAHHQVIDKTADSFRISCYSPDGQPEALERKSNEGKGFLLCVQWHPERMFRFNLQDAPASAGIRDRFLKETKK
ncbi:MAG: gamma-glutamyl-gamma-aminobutyrate hydrolase family protein, partial [Chitinophagaceae bacterium]